MVVVGMGDQDGVDVSEAEGPHDGQYGLPGIVGIVSGVHEQGLS